MFRIIVSCFKKCTSPLFLAIALLGIHSCVTPFEPYIPKYENMLVVDGFISNEYGVYYVELSKSVSSHSDIVPYVHNAIVRIYNEKNNYVSLTENANIKGRYETKSNIIKGEIGKSYKLYIKIEDKEYETDFIEMVSSPQIDSLYYNIKLLQTETTEIEGVDFYMTLTKRNNTENYIYWEFIEAWEFAMYETFNFYKGCYREYINKNFRTLNLKNKKQNAQLTEPIFAIYNNDETNERLGREYMLYVKQYGIDESGYNFIKRQQEQLESQGSLYDKTPIMIPGNIRCTTNPHEVVLGYFKVVSVQTKGVKINTKQIPFYTPMVETCPAMEYKTDDIYMEKYFVEQCDSFQEWCWRGIDTIWINNSTRHIVAIKDLHCTRCELSNSSTTPPEYWIE